MDVGRIVSATAAPETDVGRIVHATAAPEMDVGRIVSATAAPEMDVGRMAAAAKHWPQLTATCYCSTAPLSATGRQDENLHFYEAVGAITQLVQQGDSEDAAAAFTLALNDLVYTYILPGSPREINLPAKLSRHIIDMYGGNYGRAGRTFGTDVSTKHQFIVRVLYKAQREVIGILAGIFPRFEKHPIYHGFLSQSKKAPERGNLSKMTSLKVVKGPACRILLVERVEMTRRVLRRILCGMGYEVMVAEAIPDVFVSLRTESFDLVLIDSDLDGNAACTIVETIKAEDEGYLRRSKFILMYANVVRMQLEKESLIALGYQDFIPKPFSVEDINRIRRSPGILQNNGSLKLVILKSPRISSRTLNAAEV